MFPAYAEVSPYNPKRLSASQAYTHLPLPFPLLIDMLCCNHRCGIDVGLFLNIRKCTVLYMHNRNGSWNLAPYLDKYGEADPGLRRGRQLTLNQKRYDKLFRDVWLQQGIPTMIARKLEAEINNGGWETL